MCGALLPFFCRFLFHDSGEQGTPFKELQQVLPGLNRSQIQVLLRELRLESRVYTRGKTSAARWFYGPEPGDEQV